MLIRAQAVLDEMISNLNADRIPEVVALYDYPFVLQMEDQMVVFASTDEAIDYVRQFRVDYLRGGHFKVAIQVAAQEMARLGRFRVWAELLHTDPRGEPSGKSNVIYYFRVDGIRWHLEMMHVTQTILRQPTAMAVEVPH